LKSQADALGVQAAALLADATAVRDGKPPSDAEPTAPESEHAA